MLIYLISVAMISLILMNQDIFGGKEYGQVLLCYCTLVDTHLFYIHSN